MSQEESKNISIESKTMARPLPGEEIVISGLSGCFPNSNDVHEYRDNLLNKADMVSGDTSRWEHTHPEIPQRTGKINIIKNFDAGFFGVHYRQAQSLDPMVRLFLERSVEAIFDAGLHPSDLEGTNTGVFVGSCFSETEKTWFFDHLEPQQFGLTGCLRSMIPNRVSYYLKLKGPSFIADTACSSSLYALEHAYRALRDGECDKAIVGGTNLTLHPFVSLQFARLGVLSLDGSCKSFDAEGNGYARSEAVACILLQKSKDAKRIYAEVVHAKTNCDGYKEQGITYPSGDAQKKLLQEFYEECNIDPMSLSFLEAHGTGTIVGDPEEVAAIEEVFCKDRTAENFLLMGSVKSNIGHTEPSSGLCSITKCIIGMEGGLIPPNLHFTTPRQGLKALEDGRIRVVTEKTPFNDDRGLVGINSFGFGGGNCHVLLRWNKKGKINEGEPRDNLPRLVCVSGRTPESLSTIFDDLMERKLDMEHVKLYHEIFRKNIVGHLHRGFIIRNKKGELYRTTENKTYNEVLPKLIVSLDVFGNEWQKLGQDLMQLPIFSAILLRVHNTLQPKGINITDVITKKNQNPSVLDHILGQITVLLGIVDVFKKMEIEPDHFVAFNYCQIFNAYAQDALPIEDVVNFTYEVVKSIENVAQLGEAMLVHMDAKKLKALLPKEVHFTSIDEKTSIITGPKDSMNNLNKNITNQSVGISDSAIIVEQKAISKIEANVLPKLTKIIPKGIKLTKNVSTTTVDAKTLLAGFLTPKFEVLPDLLKAFDSNTVVYNIGSKKTSPLFEMSEEQVNVVQFKEASFNGLLQTLGRLYEAGFNPQISVLYPAVAYPVSRGTPMISPLIKWDHSHEWYVSFYRTQELLNYGERSLGVTMNESEYAFMLGHVVDGRNLFPATGYLVIVWETLALMFNLITSDMQVVMENCKFNRATAVGKDILTEFTIMIQRGSGKFEVIEGGVDVVSGRIFVPTQVEQEQTRHMSLAPNVLSDEIQLTTKDIYKELRLRGYNYKGDFRKMERCNLDATVAYIKWEGNWISFMDNMLQIKILQVDTRLLYVPTGIQKLILDAPRHLQYVQTFGENPLLPVFVCKETCTIKCGGIEIRGLNASSIARRKFLGEPVLEKYEFVPNVYCLDTSESIRVISQIILENNYGIRVKGVEIIDEATEPESEPLAPVIHRVLGDQPLIQPSITIFTKNQLEIPGIVVENKLINTETDCLMIVGTNLFKRPMVLQQAFAALKDKGFILSREPLSFNPNEQDMADINILTVHIGKTEKLVLFRKTFEMPKETTIVKVCNTNFDWLPKLQKNLNDTNIIIYAQNEPLSGILGLFNCLRREPGGAKIRCVLTFGTEAPKFELDNEFYSKQLDKQLAVNILKNNKWGTYRHLLLDESAFEVEREHCYVNVTVRGDLSSLRWIEGNLSSTKPVPEDKTLISVYYAALNFRDIMTASGRINADVITMDRTEQECVQGFEFSGRNPKGQRIFGMIISGALATLAPADNYLIWKVPDKWTLEEAATVPVVYGTVLMALVLKAKIKRGESILVHAGSGGIGQAAINFALHIGCTVFTTVGTQEKRDYLKKQFPQLNDRHIGNSRDLSFEKMIHKETNGKGVDIVLNSLAEEKLLASVRCLGKAGRFVEIGKFDLASNNPLNIQLLAKECSFIGLMLDQYITAHPSLKREIHGIITEGMNSGAVRPLPRTVFKDSEIEPAFRFMATGKHMGKVLIQLRKEENEKVFLAPIKLRKGVPRYSCDPEKCYIILGGLGGFGLELADWLILRGAKNVILTSRNGVKTGYQALRLKTWSTYGANVVISKADITTKEGCEELISEAEAIGTVEGIFNLAVVLKDALLENQTEESYQVSFAPKADATLFLDEVTRRRCPDLKDFVIFSSVSCGRGNPGQTNYGMANSVMERICEQRRQSGYPALAIEWGAIGDVGLVAEMQEEHTEMEIGGTLQQRISNCLIVMDKLMKQKEAAIVSSMVVAEKRSGAGGADNIVDAVANILGIKKETVSAHSTLAELGMDSMTAVEIKQTLEREFDVFLTAQDIRSMTFARLEEIQQEQSDGTGVKKQRVPTGIELMLRYLGDEATSMMSTFPIPSRTTDPNAPTVLCFPGIEGFATTLKPLGANLDAHAVGIQFPYKNPTNTYAQMAEESAIQIEANTKNKTFNIIAYSLGTIIALETVAMLEEKGYEGRIFLIDGAPEMLMEWQRQQINVNSEAEFETGVLCNLMMLYIPYENILKFREKIFKAPNFEERMKVAIQAAPPGSPHSPSYQRQVAIGQYTRMKELRCYKPTYTKIKSKIWLYKPTVPCINDFPDDYKLSEISNEKVHVKTLEGNHISILENVDLAEAINAVLRGEEEEDDTDENCIEENIQENDIKDNKIKEKDAKASEEIVVIEKEKIVQTNEAINDIKQI